MSRTSALLRPEPATSPGAGDFAAIPYLIGAIANLLSAGGSRLYRRAFGIGLGEWRLMWVVAIEPCITARRAAQIMGTDEAAVSRAVAGLERRGLAHAATDPEDRRQRLIELSPAGVELHSRIIVVARERERRLLAGFRHQEIRLLTELLRRLHANSATVDDFDPAAVLTDRRAPVPGTQPDVAASRNNSRANPTAAARTAVRSPGKSRRSTRLSPSARAKPR